MSKRTFDRRDVLKLGSIGAAALVGAGALPFGPRSALAADTITAVTWGGFYADALKQITAKYDAVNVDWSLYQTASEEIVAKTKASWPKPYVDMCEVWDPNFMQLEAENWLETVTDADLPNLKDIPASILRYRDANGGLFAIPISLGATYWGYRKDLVAKPIRELSDLLDPSLKGKICLAGASKGSGITIVGCAVGNGGSEKDMEPGWEFLKTLAKSGNIGRIATTEVDIANSLNSGECSVTFWATATWNEIKKNWPCEILTKVDSKSLKTFFYQEGFAIFKGPNANLAKQVANFALTPENQEIYNNALGQAPVNSKAKVPAAASDFAMTDEEYKKYAYFPDYAILAKEHDGWAKRWEQEIQPLLRA